MDSHVAQPKFAVAGPRDTVDPFWGGSYAEALHISSSLRRCKLRCSVGPAVGRPVGRSNNRSGGAGRSLGRPVGQSCGRSFGRRVGKKGGRTVESCSGARAVHVVGVQSASCPSLAKSHCNRVNLAKSGSTSIEMGPTPVGCGRVQPNCAQSWDTIGPNRPMWPEIGPILAGVDKTGRVSTKTGPESTKVGPTRYLPNQTRNRQTWANFGQYFAGMGEIWLGIGQSRPDIGRI